MTRLASKDTVLMELLYLHVVSFKVILLGTNRLS
jgi:hypothetical protein